MPTKESGRTTYRCKKCGDEFEGEQGGMHEAYRCFVCGGKIERVETDGGTEGRSIHGDRVESVSSTVANGGRDRDGNARTLGRWTFQYEPARELVESLLSGRVLNACAGKTKLRHDEEIVRNDLNPERDADTHHNVEEIAEHFPPQSFDTVVFDPPFDDTQAEDKYDGIHAKNIYAALEDFETLVRPGGRVITFGWNSWGMKSFSAFEREDTHLLQRGPVLRDVIVAVDRRTTHALGGGRRV